MTHKPSQLWNLAGEAVSILFRSSPGFTTHRTPHASLVLSGEPVADMNYAVIDNHPDAEHQLREFEQVFRSKGLPIVLMFSDTVADTLKPVAESLGLQNAGRLPLMSYTPASSDTRTTEYRVQKVEDLADLREANQLISKAFSLPLESVERAFGVGLLEGPGVSQFLARKGDVPVSSVQTTRAGGAVGIWCMATPPEHQRKGAGRAVLSHAIAYHTGQGATSFYLVATEAGKPLYESVGFRKVAEAAIWVLGHSTQVPT